MAELRGQASLSARPRIRLALARVLIIFSSSSVMSSFFSLSISAWMASAHFLRRVAGQREGVEGE